MAFAAIFCLVAAALAPDTIAAPGEPTVAYSLAHQRVLGLPRDRLLMMLPPRRPSCCAPRSGSRRPREARLRHVLACAAAAVPAICVQPAWSERPESRSPAAAAAPLGRRWRATSTRTCAVPRRGTVAAPDGARHKRLRNQMLENGKRKLCQAAVSYSFGRVERQKEEY